MQPGFRAALRLWPVFDDRDISLWRAHTIRSKRVQADSGAPVTRPMAARQLHQDDGANLQPIARTAGSGICMRCVCSSALCLAACGQRVAASKMQHGACAGCPQHLRQRTIACASGGLLPARVAQPHASMCRIRDGRISPTCQRPYAVVIMRPHTRACPCRIVCASPLALRRALQTGSARNVTVASNAQVV